MLSEAALEAPGPLVPPAAPLQTRPLRGLSLVRAMRTSMLSIWGDRAYDLLIIKGRSFGRDNLVVSDPAAVRRVMVENAANYLKHVNVSRLTRPIVGDGLLLAEGTEWRRQRRVLSPAFTPAHVERLVPHFTEAARGLVARVQDEPRVNLAQLLQATALDAAARALFSMPIGGRGGRLAQLARSYGAGPGRPTLFDAVARREGDYAWFTPGRPRFRKLWRREIDAIVAQRRAQPRAEGELDDLLDLMLKARDPETGEGLDDAEIRDQTSTMLTAGFETTARAMFWTLYLLSLDRPEQGRIHAELRADPPQQAGADTPRRWPRLRRAMLEAMRLYPPAPLLIRTAQAADRLGGVEVPKGATVLISPWIIHRHRKLWDRPEAFIPDRFEGKAQDHLSSGAYIPFGAGPRICIGASFAMTEAAVVMAELLSRFEVVLDDPRPLTPMSVLTTLPDIEPWFRLQPLPAA